MAHVASPPLVRQLGSLFESGSAGGLSDRQLLERFAAARDDRAEAAFATIVAEYGPMVPGLCRQLLGDHHLAEDAFQAVFLVLARQRLVIDTDSNTESKSISAVMEPAKIISGRTTFADTGEPAAHAMIHITAFRGGRGV